MVPIRPRRINAGGPRNVVAKKRRDAHFVGKGDGQGKPAAKTSSKRKTRERSDKTNKERSREIPATARRPPFSKNEERNNQTQASTHIPIPKRGPSGERKTSSGVLSPKKYD
ncbi:hypothetical protein MN608_08942 [Microdochium nivale]|nr:hypothetical protein MN608_08942 [Microdochium nivale]